MSPKITGAIIQPMIRDTVPFADVWGDISNGAKNKTIAAFVRFMEQKLGASFVYERKRFPLEKPELTQLFALAEKMRVQHVIRSFSKRAALPDEPPFMLWSAECDTDSSNMGLGASVDDDRLALLIALSEALERYLWLTRTDYFRGTTVATYTEISRRGSAIAPARVAGFSPEQIASKTRLTYDADSKFTWIKGRSLVTNKETWLPAQLVSGEHSFMHHDDGHEPLLRSPITTGLATRPKREEAILSGALEVIERDAYIIWWLNQLKVPCIDIDELASRSNSLSALVARSRRYRLRPHAFRIPTDAPAYAIGVMLEDETGTMPRVCLGLKADKNAAYAVEGALFEALRLHWSMRREQLFGPDGWDPATPAEKIGHYDRGRYWQDGDRPKQLFALANGPIEPLKSEAWEQDSDTEHLQRIAFWCKEKGYEFVSVPLTPSAANVPGWHVEMVVIPELQPMHLSETRQCLGGARLTEIPKQFGYEPRKTLFTEHPHPFL